MKVLTCFDPPPSLAPSHSVQSPIRVAAVQHAWHSDPVEHRSALREGARLAAQAGARLVCFQELTLSRYFADTKPEGKPAKRAESLDDGPTRQFAESIAREFQIHVVVSLFESVPLANGLGYNTAIVVGPDASLLGRTRKLHIPKTEGYFEDQYFQPGPVTLDDFPVYELEGLKLGVPTCWDQWFPELARAYSLAGAQVVVYPTAIGSEPDYPTFDTAPLWRQVIVGNGIANGLFMIAVNRIGREDSLTFYGSSFIADPFGRILVEGPRDEPAVLVADLELQQRDDWLTLFPFLETRRPETYTSLIAPQPTANQVRSSGTASTPSRSA